MYELFLLPILTPSLLPLPSAWLEIPMALVLTATAGAMLARRAEALGFLDLPGARKVHQVPTPRTGGLALLLGAGATLALACVMGLRGLPAWPWQTWAAGAGFFGLGMLDDRLDLKARHKFLVLLALSALAAWPWVAAGAQGVVLGRFLMHPGPALRFGVLLFWFLALPNAINIEDAINGYIGGYTLILMAVAMALGVNTTIALGALAGFLVLNWPRATHFLGDGGSFGCGFLAAEVILRAGGSGHPLQALILTAPLSMDVAMGLVRRRRLGLSPFTPDRYTFPHHLLALCRQSVLRATPLLWAHSLACACLAWFPDLAAVYLAGFALVLVGLNWPILIGARRP